MNVVPFGWMALSPVPPDFIAIGAAEPPEARSWHSGVPGITVYAELKRDNGFWSAVPAGSSIIQYSVDTAPR